MRRHGMADVEPLAVLDSDRFGHRYAEWLALPLRGVLHEPYLLAVSRPYRGADEFADVLTILREMAAGAPTPDRLIAARDNQAHGNHISISTRV
jgi:hypothetical protein